MPLSNFQRGTYIDFVVKADCSKMSWESNVDILTGIYMCLKERGNGYSCLEPLCRSFSWSTMPHLFSDFPDKLRVMLSEAANLFLVIIMIYIFQYIFNSQFSCSCTEKFHFIVVIYIGLIPIILFFILKLIKQPRTKVCGACCCGLFTQIFQLFGIGLFWVHCKKWS